MDLEDRLEELLEDAARTARRQVARVGRQTAGARRRVRRTVRAAGTATAVVLLGIAVALAALGDAGALRLAAAVLLAIPGLLAAAAAGTAHVLERRDPAVRAARAERRGREAPVEDLEDDHRVPADVRHDWVRLLQARRLVQDLSQDGWVAGTSVLEVDAEVVRLHRLLIADQRAASLGGAGSSQLAQQVADLADLLVALADEAVGLQVQEAADRSTVPATLADARAHLVAMREARSEVEGIDRRTRRPMTGE